MYIHVIPVYLIHIILHVHVYISVYHVHIIIHVYVIPLIPVYRIYPCTCNITSTCMSDVQVCHQGLTLILIPKSTT